MEPIRRKSRWRRRLIVPLVIAPLLLAAGLFAYSLQFHPEREDVPGQRAQLAQGERAAQAPRIEADRVLADRQALSAPAMAGRAVGTPGSKLARDYLRK